MPRTWPSMRRSRLLRSLLFSTYPGGVMPHTLPGYAAMPSLEAVDGGQRRVGEVLGADLHAVEVALRQALGAHRPVEVPRVDAFADDGEPPRREGDVVVDAADVAAGSRGVALEQ